jgi:tripartite-type tricarboxylate transporter receptor subunit TctC
LPCIESIARSRRAHCLPVKSIPQLVAYAKANPGKLNFGAPNGGTVQLSGELFKMMTGVNIVHVPYSNQMQAVTDLIVGQIQVSFDVMPTTIEYARAGKLRALAVTTATRSPALPDIPTWAISCRATRRVRGMALVCPRIRP